MTGDGERYVMGLVLTTNAELVSRALRGAGAADGPSMMAAVAATRTLDLTVNDILRALVRQARAQGCTWAEIGEVLHVTRQAAFQRFGRSTDDPRPEETVTKPIQAAADKASAILGDWLHERYGAVRRRFDARMLEQCTVEMLAAVRGQTRETAGELVELGAGVVSVSSGYTVVDVPIAFGRAGSTGRIMFDADECVAGFFILPAWSA
jgi:hypothetical protein